ncbi:anthranilate phosphoribosyltransferase [Amycolatopsis bartoniae]|uniref:Anthranilate phosphoribosyltransferase n=1 Tax=Amycolatopsis bartoniae TaxID=941986 RepID=A0A8H9J1R4_9PSEU|nr:anthranilate phosphoribosyltransferase [Amycolatopsis bartoniae]MBB2934073.1 anthranilate phosphoribosyltransferase [Amycolatopsis bartoniae]TVT07365.1 anthranilate phosphoribosyltransferase [Amycolatopsis bartoniae]GHF84545.1 anthranilate phosphoribosyltransferase [Amycolatopsis bartoniae]
MTAQIHSWPALLTRLIDRADLSEEDTAWAMDQVMSGEATLAQIGGFAVALRAKGETPEEIAGMARAMLDHARRVHVEDRAVDIVGTGGDRSGSVNISTMASLVVAGAGVPVVKHGNRAASSKSGAADVLEALGVAIDLPPEGVQRCVAELGIGFCFAPVFHPAFRHAGPARSQLGVPTTFNLLGPLTNPAQPDAGLIGCAYADRTELLARVFARRGASALVVRGDDGLDEITTTTTSTVWVVSDGEVRQERFDPASLGIPYATAEDLRGGEAAVNAEVVRELVAGKTGPVRDAVLLNAAGALAAHAGFSGSLTADLEAALARAAQAVDSGAAADLLARWAAFR